MEIKLYITEDADNVINKDLTLVSTVSIQLRDTQEITTPVVLLGEIEGVDLKTVNYAYMDEFERFYFIRSISVGPNNIYALALECDVIETYKEDILNSSALINRAVKQGDYVDMAVSSEVRKEVEVFKSNRGFNEDKTIILSTVGTEVK